MTHDELVERVARYAREEMALHHTDTDQHENWILGHMVTLASLIRPAVLEEAEEMLKPSECNCSLLIRAMAKEGT